MDISALMNIRLNLFLGKRSYYNMRVKTKNAGQAAFMKMGGAKFIKKENTFYIFESDIKRKNWRQAYAESELSAFNQRVIHFLNLNKG